jgi:hypothetical protein
MPLGSLAALATAASVVVAVTDGTARRALGAAFLVLDACLIVAAITDDGFRFIWDGGEGELFRLEVALALCGLILITPRLRTPSHGQRSGAAVNQRRSLTGPARAVGYLCGVVLLTLVAFEAGTEHFYATNCSGPGFDGECDVASLEGLVWAIGAIVVSAAVRKARNETPGRRDVTPGEGLRSNAKSLLRRRSLG